MKTIPSTKFLLTVFAMIGVTAVELYLLYLGHFEYTEWYFGFMILDGSSYKIGKTYQNLSMARNGNGKGDGE